MGGEGDLEAVMVGQEKHVSVEDGIGGGDMEARFRMGQEMQVSKCGCIGCS
jgi:hypothetical protein